jgi:hypothetical protein
MSEAPKKPNTDGKAFKFPYGQQVHTDARFTSFVLIIPIVKIPAPRYIEKAAIAYAPPHSNKHKKSHSLLRDANATSIRMLVMASARYATPKSFKNDSGKVRQLAMVLSANEMAPPSHQRQKLFPR